MRDFFVFRRSGYIPLITVFGWLLVGLLGTGVAAADEQRPNVVIILADDLGYADVGFQQDSASDVRTPNIDALARDGVRFTNGYVSGNVCATTRAGLLTGRYQQRFGFYQHFDSRVGIPSSELTFADLMKREGYVTGIIGKWHVGYNGYVPGGGNFAGGYARGNHPLERGFDRFYGYHLHGAHDYWDLSPERGELYNAIYSDQEIVDDTGRGYLTDILAEEAVSFISSAGDQPFLLYLPFTAVHEPKQAREQDLARFDTGSGNRDVLLAILWRMDIAIGRVVEALRDADKLENTLIVFLSDNGGPVRMHANNRPLRGHKHTFYEGGVRVPFFMTWPAELQSGLQEEPVISLDVLPTIIAAAAGELPKNRQFDGVNLLPLLRGETDSLEPRYLFFDDHTDEWAVRYGRWKLYSSEMGEWELYDNQGDLYLYDLENDLAEQNNLIEQYPDTARSLKEAVSRWRKELAPPMTKPVGEIVR